MKKIPFITGITKVAELTNFGQGPIKGEPKLVGRGENKPRIHQLGDNKYITKSDPQSVAFEPLMHDLGSKLGVKVPKTIRRMLPDENGNIVPHSVQQMVHGYTGAELNRIRGVKPKEETTIPRHLKSHPDMLTMALFDKLANNPDRHGNNFMYDEHENKVHAIDNGLGMAFNPLGNIHPDFNPIYSRIDSNLNSLDGPIPHQFRQNVLNADPEEHKKIIDSHEPHLQKALTERNIPYSEVIKDEYVDNLNRFKKHFANPNIKTIKDFRNAWNSEN